MEIVMRHWVRCSRTGDFFYAVMVIAAFVVMRFSFLADVVVYASSFSNAEPAHASNDAGWKDRKVVVAAGEKK
jgi:hypothetical protein